MAITRRQVGKALTWAGMVAVLAFVVALAIAVNRPPKPPTEADEDVPAADPSPSPGTAAGAASQPASGPAKVAKAPKSSKGNKVPAARRTLSGYRVDQIRYAAIAVPKEQPRVVVPERQVPALGAAEERAWKLRIYASLGATVAQLRASQRPEDGAVLKAEEARLAELGRWLKKNAVTDAEIAAARAEQERQEGGTAPDPAEAPAEPSAPPPNE
jgi:hypothetical protein